MAKAFKCECCNEYKDGEGLILKLIRSDGFRMMNDCEICARCSEKLRSMMKKGIIAGFSDKEESK